MKRKPKISVSWSGGKDSSLALRRILNSGEYEVDHLHTVIDSENGRVGLHGIMQELIEQQAKSMNIPLRKLYLNASNDHSNYETLIKSYYQQLNSEGINKVLFGDIFLEDLKDYRDKMLNDSGLQGVYPLWKQNTNELLDEFITNGFKTVICAANKEYFSENDLGITMDREFKNNLHEAVDPCGENGEFHTFVYDGPIFSEPVLLEKGQVIERSYSYNKENDRGELIQLKSTFLFQELK